QPTLGVLAGAAFADIDPLLFAAAHRLPSSRVHLQVRILAQPADRDQGLLPPSGQTLLGASIAPRLPRGQDQSREVLGGGAAPEWTTQVRTLLRVETEIPQSVRGEAAAVAVRTERRGRGGDD